MALRERKDSWQADVYWKDFKSKVEAQAWIDDTKERLRKGIPLDARLDDNPETAGMTLNRLLELTASIRWKNPKDGERPEQQAREMVNMLGGTPAIPVKIKRRAQAAGRPPAGATHPASHLRLQLPR